MPRLRSRAAPAAAPLTAPSTAPTASSTRPRRSIANQAPAAAVIQRSSPEETRQSIHLTVKSSPGKLRQATRGAVPKSRVSRPSAAAGKRTSRSSRVVREIDSDEDDEDDEADDAEEGDPMDVDDDDDAEDDDGAEGDDDEDMDAAGDDDEDVDDTPAPPPAPRTVAPPSRSTPANPAISITKSQNAAAAKEMAMDASDDDLSDPDSDLDGDEEDAEGEDEDAEGDEDDEMDVTQADGLDELDSDGELLSRDPILDVTKMTKRQRAMVADEEDGALLALSNEAQKKKHLTAEEHAMRRAEMARRRKNLSEKRNEEEKLDTINRLLKKQPPKRGRRAVQDAGSGAEDEDTERANPLFVRYVQNAKGAQLAVPDEWLKAPVGGVLAGAVEKPSSRPWSGRMVEEVA